MSQTVREIIDDIELKKVDFEFMSTGFPRLDSLLDGGFLRKELVVLGGKTGIGKSYLAGQTMYNIVKNGFKSAYFSLEISNNMVVSRLIGQLANVKSTHIVSGNVNPVKEGDKEKAENMLVAYENQMSFYDDLYDFEEIYKEIQAHDFDFVVIDFIQNIIMRGMDEYTRLSHVALSLQKLAKEKNCTIMVLSQLSNMMAREKGDSNVEYKGSGSIATVCDLGFFIERQPDLLTDTDNLTLNLRKNRRGISGRTISMELTGEGGFIHEKAYQDQA